MVSAAFVVVGLNYVGKTLLTDNHHLAKHNAVAPSTSSQEND